MRLRPCRLFFGSVCRKASQLETPFLSYVTAKIVELENILQLLHYFSGKFRVLPFLSVIAASERKAAGERL